MKLSFFRISVEDDLLELNFTSGKYRSTLLTIEPLRGNNYE